MKDIDTLKEMQLTLNAFLNFGSASLWKHDILRFLFFES